MNLGDRVVMFLATGFYTGKAPIAPGTFGTLPGLLLCWAISGISATGSVALILALIALAVWMADRAEKQIGSRDPGSIVIDEIAGMTVTLVGLPFAWHTALAGFVVFRILDIAKPFPVRFLERRLSGGVGIVADDVAAGIMGNILLRIGYAFMGS
jgi:phosphatidylglycerophosphatase A